MTDASKQAWRAEWGWAAGGVVGALALLAGCALFESAEPSDGGKAVAAKAQPQGVDWPEAPQPQPMLMREAESYADRLSAALATRPEPRTPVPDVLWLNQEAQAAPAVADSRCEAPPSQAAQASTAAGQPPAPVETDPSPSTQPAVEVSRVPSTQPSVTTDTVQEAPVDAPALVSRLAACIDNDSRGPMAKAVRLASLRLVEPEVVPDPQAVAGLDEPQRQSILLYQQLIGRLAEKLEAGERFSRELVLKQADLLPLIEPLKIRTLRLCRRVRGFGAYEPLETSSLLAGSDHPMIVYVELEDFRSVPLGADRYQVKLAQEVSLYSEADGLAVWRQPPAEIVDESRNARRDFFVVQQIQLPARLTVGKYLLKVRVTDLHARTLDEEACPLQVVADPAMAAAQK